MVPVDECSSGSKCQLSSGCSNVLVVKDSPLVVNANSTALVGVTAYVEARCKCNALTFDRCTAFSCLNGGTCQQLDNSFKSVDDVVLTFFYTLLKPVFQHAACFRKLNRKVSAIVKCCALLGYCNQSIMTRSDQPGPPAVMIVRQNGLSSASSRASVADTPVSRQIWWTQVVDGRPQARLHSCGGRSPSLVVI